MPLQEYIDKALSRKTTTGYIWFLACLLLFASHVHIANMLGWNGKSWLEFPRLWQTMDVLLLGFDLIVAMGLIYRKTWAVITLFAGILFLQIIPFTVFRSYFVTRPADENLLNSLLGMEISLLLVLLVLIVLQGRMPKSVDEK